MSDRINYITVVLEQNMREEDCAPIIQAISLIKGVLKVESNVSNHTDFISESRAKNELLNKIINLLT